MRLHHLPLGLFSVALAVPFAIPTTTARGADLPEALQSRHSDGPDREALDALDFLLSVSLTRDQARAILPSYVAACRIRLAYDLERAEILPEEIEAYSAFLAEDRLNQGFSPDVERRTQEVHHRAIRARDELHAALNAAAGEIWTILSPYQQYVAADYQPQGEALFAFYATPKERRERMQRERDRAKERFKKIRRARQRGQIPDLPRPKDPRVIQAEENLRRIHLAKHPQPDNLARYLLTPAAAEPLYALAKRKMPQDVRKAIYAWRFGVPDLSRAQARLAEEHLRRLTGEINNWNLANGMHFSAGQLEQLVYLAGEWERLKYRQHHTKPKRRMRRDTFQALQVQIERAAEDVLRPGQREILATYQPCLIPPKNLKDPVRVGQAADSTRMVNWLQRARGADEAARHRMIDRLVDRETKELAVWDEAARRAALTETVAYAASLDDVDFALEKEALGEAIQAPDRKVELQNELATLHRVRLEPGRTSRFLLNPGFVQVLTARYAQLRNPQLGRQRDLAEGPQAPDCDDDPAVRRARKE